MRGVKYIFLGLIIGIIGTYALYQFMSNTSITTDSDVVVERIQLVKKMIVSEGYFSEIYSYKDATNFYDLIEFEKKALLLVKGKAQVSYDLAQIDYQINEETKTIFLVNIPAPEITIEPEIKYYDLQESTFNSFDVSDYNKLNSEAIKQLKQKIEESELKNMARSQLETALNDIQLVGKELGWKVVIPKT